MNMIISRTPYRISFFGGGTDYPEWYLKEGGAVLSTAIDKYCHISCRPLPRFFELKYRVVWSHIEKVGTIAEILHPAVREGLRYMGINGDQGLEIHHQGDLPARAGMGSSSSFAVGLILALCAYQEKMIGQYDLAMRAIDLEQNHLKDNVGSQDQVAAAWGGTNLIEFCRDGNIRVNRLTVSRKRLEALQSSLMLFFTGTSRLSSEVSKAVIANLTSKRKVLKKMHQMVYEALDILNSDCDLNEFGRLMNRNWELKRSISSRISNEKIDRLYKKALDHGALGGKLLGAGGSGFMVFFIPQERRADLKEALDGYLHVPFRFENEGSRIIHYTRQEYE
jgi:D-glycero-alpha-D-manno-heptose-7-phosphate kinase